MLNQVLFLPYAFHNFRIYFILVNIINNAIRFS